MPVLIEKNSLTSQKFRPRKSIGEKIRILIAESSDHDYELILEHFNKSGLKFFAKRINSFVNFQTEISKFNPAIILSEYSLPDFSAIEALKYLNDTGIKIPFIVIASSIHEDEIVNCLKSGSDNFVLKSNLSRLSSVIQESIGRQPEYHYTESGLLHYLEICENFLLAESLENTGYFIIDGLTKKVLTANETVSDIFGYELKEIFELVSISKLVTPQNLELFQSTVQKLITKKNAVENFRCSFIKSDKQTIHLEITAKQLLKDIIFAADKTSQTKQPENVQILLVVRDVTEKLKIELMQMLTSEALIESEKRFRSFIEGVKDYAIFMLDPFGRITSWNEGAERILGYSESEIILKNFNILSHPIQGQTNSIKDLLQQVKKEGRVETELWLEKNNHKSFWASVSITTFFEKKNKPLNFSVIIRDLTESKIKEEQLSENEKQLRALAAHLQVAREEERTRIARELHDEFSQLLTAVRLDLTILGRMISKLVLEPSSRLPLLEKITSVSDLLESTIKSIRRLITQLRPSILDELGLLTAMQWQAQEFESRTNIKCRITRLQHGIHVDQNTSTALFRIFQEALTNVAKHAFATSVSISLQIIGNEIILEISDNGKGINKNKLKDPTSTGIMGIRERVIALSGKFEINSEINKGTKLIVSIPYNNT